MVEPLSELPRMVLALSFVVVLMLAIAALVRRVPQLQAYVGQVQGQEPRLRVVTSLLLDARHRIVIVKIDGQEKTFLLSPESATEVKS